MTIHWKAVEQYFTVECFSICKNLSGLELALSGVKGLNFVFTSECTPSSSMFESYGYFC